MTRCFSRLLLAALLGAGLVGARPLAALAGDKIEYSWSSEKTLAMPAVEHPEENPVDLSFGRSSVGPVVDFGFPAPPPVTIVPFKNGNRLEGRNGNSDSIFGNPLAEGILGNADGRRDEDWNSSSAGTNLNSRQKSWDLGSAFGADDRNLGYGEAGSRGDSADPYARRDRLNNSASGRYGEMDWTGRADSTYSRALGNQKTSVFDLFFQKQPRFSPETDFYNSAGASGDGGAYGEPAMPAVDAGAGNREDLHSSPGGDSTADARSSVRPEGGDRNPIPYERAWDRQSNPDPVSQQNAKPQYVPPSTGQSPAQQHPSRLSFPKGPGSVF
ncbi:MAG: hypothetical protein ABSA47_09850 [Verrucomicrobiota bacterium]|jgi:hypothetical protein